MNPYFKEADALFRKAIESLHRNGFDASQEIIQEAFLLDPYRLQMHYELALHFASVKVLARFEYHFLICRSLDASCGEKILTNDIVVNAFRAEEIARILAPKDKTGSSPRKQFTAIDPFGDQVFLRFKSAHKNDIEAIYHSLDADTRKYLNLDQPAPVSIADYYDDPDFTKIDHFVLDHGSDRVYADAPVEELLAVLSRLASHVEAVRFLMAGEQDSFVDEVIIRNGLLHVYRHELGDDDIATRLEYFEAIANRYDDVMIRKWLTKEYLDNALLHIKYDYEGAENASAIAQQFIDKAALLASPDSAFFPFVKGMLFLKQKDPQAALLHFREAAANASEQQIDFFDAWYELGKLGVLETTGYSESIEHLSAALQIRPYTAIYIYRALAFLKLNRISEATADIDTYIDKINPHNSGSFITAARLLSEAGFKTWGNRLCYAGLEKNTLYENELIEKWEKVTDPNKTFYDSQLSSNAQTRSSLYTLLSINAVGSKRYDYALKALSLVETDPLLLFNMGVVLNDQGKIAEAEQYYDRALAQDSNFIKALNNKSIIRMLHKDYATALALTDQILKIDSAYAEAFSTRASISFYTGDLPSALKQYKEYLALQPASEKGHFGVGFIYAHLRQDEQAIPYLQKAIELAPNNAQVNEMYSNLASCYNNTGRLAEGMEAAERSIAVNPNYYHPYFVLACIYKKEERDEEALEMVKKTLSLAPSQRHQIINEPDLAGLKEKIKSL